MATLPVAIGCASYLSIYVVHRNRLCTVSIDAIASLTSIDCGVNHCTLWTYSIVFIHVKNTPQLRAKRKTH